MVLVLKANVETLKTVLASLVRATDGMRNCINAHTVFLANMGKEYALMIDAVAKFKAVLERCPSNAAGSADDDDADDKDEE